MNAIPFVPMAIGVMSAAAVLFSACAISIAEGAVHDWRVGYTGRALEGAGLAAVDMAVAGGAVALIVTAVGG
jgi:hypothetical protein